MMSTHKHTVTSARMIKSVLCLLISFVFLLTLTPSKAYALERKTVPFTLTSSQHLITINYKACAPVLAIGCVWRTLRGCPETLS